MHNLALCSAASGGGSQTNIQVTTLFCSVSSGPADRQWYESLELAVSCGLLDCIGTGLMFIPEPICQISGFLLSGPSKITWVYQTYILIERWRNKPRQ
jgi:hypothetical protein